MASKPVLAVGDVIGPYVVVYVTAAGPELIRIDSIARIEPTGDGATYLYAGPLGETRRRVKIGIEWWLEIARDGHAA